MKKALRKATFLFSGILALSLCTGCTGTPTAPSSPPGSSQLDTPSSKVLATTAPTQEPTSSGAAVSESEGKSLIVYFSATGNTKAVAQVIAEETGGELYEIVPQSPYTTEDLNWSEPGSRSNQEHDDPSIRPAIAGEAKDLSGYSTIYIGYPLWWGEAPNIVLHFVESNDFTGKTLIPFATSSSSGFGSSGETLVDLAPDATWLEGQRFPSGVAAPDIISWLKNLAPATLSN